MSLYYGKIQNDLKAALKQKDIMVVSVLRMLNAAIKNKELEKRNNLRGAEDVSKLEKLSKLTDEEILEVVAREAKKRKEAIGVFSKGGREELVLKEKKELDILEKYLPKQFSKEEINMEIEKIISGIKPQGMRDFGKVMGALMAKLKGRADGSVVGKLLRDRLQNL